MIKATMKYKTMTDYHDMLRNICAIDYLYQYTIDEAYFKLYEQHNKLFSYADLHTYFDMLDRVFVIRGDSVCINDYYYQHYCEQT